MKVLFYLFFCLLYSDNSESTCTTLLMCPSFCMKVKQGCYVCDCGMFSNYLNGAAEHMAVASNKHPLQTGTRLSSYTSGYSAVGNNKGVPNTQNGLSVQDYSNMMQMGFQFTNLQPYNTKPLVPHMSAHDLTEYGHSFKDMPGMNCVPVNDRCPSSCWTTNVYTGCLHCDCGVVFGGHHDKPQYQSTESSVQTSATVEEHARVESTTVKDVQSHISNSDNFYKLTEKTFQLLSASKRPDISASPVVKIVVPTKPSKAVLTTNEPDSTAQNTDVNMNEERLTNPTLSYGNTAQPSVGFAVPTPLPTSSNRDSVPKTIGYAAPTPLQTSSYRDLAPMIVSYAIPTPLQTLNHEDSVPKTLSYAVPTFLPKVNSSFLISFPKSAWKFTENNATYLNHTKNRYTSQTKTNVRDPFNDGLTITSRIIDALRDSTGNNAVKITEQIVQSTSFSKLEQPLKPLFTSRTTTHQTTTEHNSPIPLHLSLASTGGGDAFRDKPSKITSGESNNYGFYGHVETG